MSELASYSIQAIFFALVAVVVVSRSKKTDLYQFALISIWLIGVIAIYARYGEDQVLFYSNDQRFHADVVKFYLPINGIQISEIIGLRYVLTVPAYLISLFGFNSALVFKFFQLGALLLLYRQSQIFMNSLSLRIRIWQLPLIAGPILIFMSLLSLRDVILAYFTLVVIISVSKGNKILGIAVVFLLRPHLAIALSFGIVLYHVCSRIHTRYQSFRLSAFALLSYVSGTIAYWTGAFVQQGVNFDTPTSVFSQFKFAQLAANFLGLQFLALSNSGDSLVASSTSTLLFARLLFFETILIPLLFLISVFRHTEFLTKQKMITLQAFLFFYGVVSQTTWNSTRQNIPFLACMGLLAVADIEHFRKIKAKVAPKLLMATR
ncbi:MAG: hypothetical protein RL729_1050 [Actinomycetota bacterium]|jgi:hypothetical protein